VVNGHVNSLRVAQPFGEIQVPEKEEGGGRGSDITVWVGKKS